MAARLSALALPLCSVVLSLLTPLSLSGADLQAPSVQGVAPVPGDSVTVLSEVRVTFDEAVTGVERGSLLLNGNPAASVSGLSNAWTFVFSQPFPGAMSLRFALDHTLTDLAGNRLNAAAASSSWSYTLVDTVPPKIASVAPSPGAMLSDLNTVTVTFSEPVLGLDAGDLLVNGQPALAVEGGDQGPYVFTLASIPTGLVTLGWKPGHGMRDMAPVPNDFVGSDWTYLRLSDASSADVVIREILADNLNGLRDENGNNEDWIELWNRGASEVRLLGWSLSDDASNPSLWTFPDLVLQPGGSQVVFASGKDRRSSIVGAQLHTNFRLSNAGETLALYDASSPRRQKDGFSFPEQRPDISWGRSATGFSYFARPSPGGVNGDGGTFEGVVAAPTASVQSGFFRDPLLVHLSSATFGSRIYYTLDGSPPTDQSPRYLKPLSLGGTPQRAVVTLRAVAVRDGLLPSTLTTHSYLYPEHVLTQPATPEGFPTTWVTLNNQEASASTTADYGMDPRVVTNKNNRELILQGLASLPTISVVTATPLLFGNNGVYSRRQDTNQQAVHVEMLLPDGKVAFRQDCGLEIQGGSSTTDSGGDWKCKNLSLRLLFRGDFGPGKLLYPVYEGSPVKEFDTLVLDAELNMVWNHMTDGDQRNRGQYAREQFINDMMQGTGILAPRGRYVHLYLNGLYWGMKNLHERADASWAAQYMGGDPAEYDVLKHEGTAAGLQDGTLASYNAMLSVARSGLAKNTAYEALQQHLDLDWFIDYMMVNFYGGNTDWDSHNWYAVRRRVPGSAGWRFVSWDAEHVLKDASENVLGVSNGNAPSEVFQALKGNPEFRLRFADHVHRHFFNGGIFYVDRTRRNYDPGHPEWNRPAAAYMKVIQQIDPAIVAESARWGDVARPGQPYTRDVEWLRELQSLLFITNSPGNTVRYFPTRSSNVLSSFRAVKLYPTVEAPSFSQHGGLVPEGYALAMSAPSGVIYFTTNGTDPRVYGSGAVSPHAIASIPGQALEIFTTLTIKSRTLLNVTNWSALNEASFTVAELGSKVRFTEIHYNPPGGDAYEFVELRNAGSQDADLSLATVEGIGFAFGPGISLPAGAHLVLASGVNTNAWRARYPGIPFAGTYPGSLSNGGERLVLRDATGNVLTSVDYSDGGGWPRSADGGGRSLERIDTDGDADDPSNWRASSEVNGSPGLPPVAEPAPQVWINEIRAADDLAHPDFVELWNPGTQQISLSGWSFSDGSLRRTYVLPSGAVLAAGGYLVILCDTNQGAGLHSGFGLDRDGDRLFLHDATSNRVDAVTFGQQLSGYTLGRVEWSWTVTSPTPGLANTPALLAAPASLRVNEWVANAAPGGQDWIELFNTSVDQPVGLHGLYFGVGSQVLRWGYPAFVGPGGFIRLWADEQSGPSHLDFKLPASGGTIRVFDASGTVLDTVVYESALSGVSSGRYPDGAAPPFVAFPGSASPGASNYQIAGGGPVISEILAANRAAQPGPFGNYPDWVELWNGHASALVLDGYRVSRDGGASSFAFPSGVSLASGAYLVLWCDGSRPASVSSAMPLNSGFSISGSGGDLALVDPFGRVVSLVSYGPQLPDKSIGLSGDAWALLAKPTPGAVNSAALPVVGPGSIRINEWMARPDAGYDWVEIFNGADAPALLTGCWITDDASLQGIRKTQWGSLSYIEAGGYLQLTADGQASKGAGHLNFRLEGDGGVIRLYTSALEPVDGVSFGSQTEGVSQGRFPDGGDALIAFVQSASPGESNWLPIPHLVVNEVLSRAVGPQDDFVELANLSADGIAIGGWFLSDRAHDLRRYRIPAGRVVPGNGLLALSALEYGGAFHLDSANDLASANDEFSLGDELYLSEADGEGNLTGHRLVISFGASEIGVSFGRQALSYGDMLVPLIAPTPGTPNAAPRSGPVVIHEVRAATQASDAGIAFLELLNLSTNSVALRDPEVPQHGWRVRGGVDFQIPPSTELLPRAFLLLVGFDPASDPVALAAFRSFYGLPASVPVLGPWHGQLELGRESVKLEKPVGVEPANRPDAGQTVYVEVDQISRRPDILWPTPDVFNGLSLQRRRPEGFGEEPFNWFAALPTPGRANRVDSDFIDLDHDGLSDRWELANGFNPSNPADAENDGDGDGFTTWQEYQQGSLPAQSGSTLLSPRVVLSPISQWAGAGSTVFLNVAGVGTEPLRYQWWFRGLPLTGATGASLILRDVQADHAGDYFAVIGNPLSSDQSATARLSVFDPPSFVQQPQSIMVNPGSNVTFRVLAETDLPPIRYQWRFNGSDIPGETGAQLVLNAVQLPQEGDYSVWVSNPFAQSLSQTARLTVKVRPVIVVQPTPTNQVVAVGDSATFTVRATGSLPMSFRWKRGTATLTNITLLSGTCVFTLPIVQTNQAGKYSVTVTNLAGGASPANSSNSDLLVFFRPVISNSPASQVSRVGGSVTFRVTASGSAPLSYQWLFDSEAIPGATLSTLSLDDLRASQQGSYSVVVSNLVGKSTSVPATLSLRLPTRLSIEERTDGVEVVWSSAPGQSYLLQSRDDLTTGDWMELAQVVASDWTMRRRLSEGLPGRSRYYRVLLLP